MRKKKRKRTGISLHFYLLALISFAIFPASAQQTGSDSNTRLISTRSIEGQVLTSSGAPVAGAVVLLKDGKTLQVRSYIAQKDGAYHFFGLSTDVNYTLRAENQDLTSKQKTVSVFDSHRQVKLDLKLSKKIQQPKK
jgi:Carboxypeptidase regulatory-like domain